jgi:hypothetical protein
MGLIVLRFMCAETIPSRGAFFFLPSSSSLSSAQLIVRRHGWIGLNAAPFFKILSQKAALHGLKLV